MSEKDERSETDDGQRPDTDDPGLAATDAFELLAHDTRLAAMEVLWEADEPLRFSEVSDRTGISDTGNFNYHFGKLVGHFVRESEGGYELTRSGRHAMTAVLAGDVTEDPSFEPVVLDEQCPFCGENIVISHDADLLHVSCSACAGTYSSDGDTDATPGPPNPDGTIATFDLPAAGIQDREPEEILSAALQRVTSHTRDVGNGLCPECAGKIEITANICTDHDRTGICDTCNSRYVGLGQLRCESCQDSSTGPIALTGLAKLEGRKYFLDHGVDPFDPSWDDAVVFFSMYERVCETDPPELEAIWNLDGETLTIRFDDEANVVDIEREGGA